MELSVRLESFEGPLDLLLHLLDKNKVSIYDIPIVEITNQYLEYIDKMQRQDLNVVSEFLVMAATLLDIKARWLLPKEEEDEEEEDPRAELVEQLLQYKMYKYMSLELKDRQIDAGRKLYRAQELPEAVLAYEMPVDTEELTEGISLEALHEVFEQVLSRQERKVDTAHSKFGTIEQEEVSVEEKMEFIENYIHTHAFFSFRELLERQNSRVELIVTFLAILELMRTGTIRAEQKTTFGEIRIAAAQKNRVEGS